MKVILGRYMDGGAWPDAVGPAAAERESASAVPSRTAAGVHIVGPAGFLSLLEEKMGLPCLNTHESRRIASWQQLLARRTEEERPNGAAPFYASSFKKDDWNTARRVLSMRDELKFSGALEGSACDLAERALECAAAGLHRLAEMYELEQKHASAPLPGAADRMRLILTELSLWGISGLHLVELTTPEKLWEKPWQEMFSLLRKSGVTVNDLSTDEDTNGDRPLSVEFVSSLPVFSGRGECFRLTATNLPEAAEALAAVLRERLCDGTLGRTVMLRKNDSFELDAALERFSLPRTSCRARSAARPYLQLLPLYLRLQFLPFSPETLRQFLLLPTSPLSRGLRRRLLNALRFEEFSPEADSFSSWPERWRSAFLRNGVTDEKLTKQIRWFCPQRRVLPAPEASDGCTPETPGIPSAALAEAAEALAEWAEKQPAAELKKTAELCRRLSDIARDGKKTLSAPELEKILDAVIGSGERSPGSPPALPWCVLNDPGQLWGPADTVIWWDFTDDGSSVRESSTWSDEERRWLEKQDRPLCCAATERRARTLAQLNPFLFGRRVITVEPRFHGREKSSPHPLAALLPQDGFVEKDAFCVLTGKKRISSDGGSSVEEKPGDFFHLDSRSPLPRPTAAAPWNENRRKPLSLPESIQASSLESLLTCPAAWYFKNVLRLEGGGARLSADQIVCGNLAHAAMTALLERRQDCARRGESMPEVTDAVLFDLLSRLAPQSAARLALPEHEHLLRDMAGRLKRSFLRLCARTDAEGLIFLNAEQSLEGELDGVALRGRYDLLFGRKKDKTPCLVVDMKWSRRKTYEEQTTKGCPVQLAAYHYLLEHGSGTKNQQAPCCAHLDDAWFLLLPEADIHAASDGKKNLAQHWKDVEERWHALRGELEHGRLDLAENAPDEDACQWCDYRELCGVNQPVTDDEEDAK